MSAPQQSSPPPPYAVFKTWGIPGVYMLLWGKSVYTLTLRHCDGLVFVQCLIFAGLKQRAPPPFLPRTVRNNVPLHFPAAHC